MNTNRWTAVGVSLAAIALTAGCGSTTTKTDDPPGTTAHIVAVASTDAALGQFPRTVSGLIVSKDVVAVVVGRITAVRYEFPEQLAPMTAITVSVARARGTSATEVTAWEPGGIIPLTAHSADDRARLSGGNGFTASDPSAMIDYRPVGDAAHPQVGDQVLLFLTANPNEGSVAGGYLVAGAAYGRFQAGPGTGTFTRATRDDGILERTVAASALEVALS